MKPMNIPALLLIAACASNGAVAQEKEADPTQGFKFKPHMLDAKGGTGSVLAVDFEYKKAWEKIAPLHEVLQAGKDTADKQKTGMHRSICGGYSEESGKVIPSWVAFTDCSGEVSVKGTLAADAAKNPNKLIDFSGSYSRQHFRSDRASTLMFGIGGQAKYETDQSFDNKQFVFGLKGTFTHLAGCTPAKGEASCMPKLDFLGLSVGFQRVNPATDTARETALAGAPLENYQRWEFEGFYKYNLPNDWNYLSDVELNYRHFQELSAPAAVRTAGLDRHRLGLIRVNFALGGKGALATTPKMFVQYSRGSLPFDTTKERAVKIGVVFEIF
jgi:hypothetical protein